MIQFLKFGASFFLPPGIFFLAFLFLAFFAWKKGERFAAKAIVLITAVFYLLSTYLVADVLMGALESAYAPPAKPEGDVVIMLGGGAFSDAPDVDGEGALTASPSTRLLTAVRLAQKLDLPILVTSAFHMKRSVLNYEKLGIEVVPYPTDYMVSHHPIFHVVKLAPSADALHTNAVVLQECLRTAVTYCLGK